MAKASRASIYNTDLKKRLPVTQCIGYMTQAEENLYTLEKVSLGAVQQLGSMSAQACSVGQSILEKQHKAARELIRMSRELLECRSADELYDLQQKALQSMMGFWMDELSQLGRFGVPTNSFLLPPD